MPRKTRRTPSKPASNRKDVTKVGGKGDFGVPVGNEKSREVRYTSRNTKAADRGAAQPRSGEGGGARETGAGSHASGPGAGSGGDLDTDFTGVSGSGLAASGNFRRPPGPDDSDGSSREFASGPPATGKRGEGR
jgi:hypothetical protein